MWMAFEVKDSEQFFPFFICFLFLYNQANTLWMEFQYNLRNWKLSRLPQSTLILSFFREPYVSRLNLWRQKKGDSPQILGKETPLTLFAQTLFTHPVKEENETFHEFQFVESQPEIPLKIIYNERNGVTHGPRNQFFICTIINFFTVSSFFFFRSLTKEIQKRDDTRWENFIFPRN